MKQLLDYYQQLLDQNHPFAEVVKAIIENSNNPEYIEINLENVLCIVQDANAKKRALIAKMSKRGVLSKGR